LSQNTIVKSLTHISQAQWHVAQTNTKPKSCHRACLSANTDFADTKKTKSFKDRENGITELKNKLKPLTGKNAQLVTHGIVHAGFSGFRAFVARKKVGVN